MIYEYLNESVVERIASVLLRSDEKTDISGSLLRKHGFHIRVPEFYHLLVEKGDSNYIRIGSDKPDKWISISWKELLSGEEITVGSDEAMNYRDSVYSFFGEMDKVNREHTTAGLKILNRTRVIQLTGLWENDSVIAGGPFINYQFFDRNSGRFYMIDGAVFAPNENKIKYIKELEAIIRTFSPAGNEKAPPEYLSGGALF